MLLVWCKFDPQFLPLADPSFHVVLLSFPCNTRALQGLSQLREKAGASPPQHSLSPKRGTGEIPRAVWSPGLRMPAGNTDVQVIGEERRPGPPVRGIRTCCRPMRVVVGIVLVHAP